MGKVKKWVIGIIALSLIGSAAKGSDHTDDSQKAAKVIETQAVTDKSNAADEVNKKENVSAEQEGVQSKEASSNQNEVQVVDSEISDEAMPEEKEVAMILSEESVTTPKPAPSYKIRSESGTRYAKSSVNVRSGPGVNETKLGELSKDEAVEIIGKTDNGWYQIMYNGEEGFVSASYLIETLQTPAPSKNSESVKKESKQIETVTKSGSGGSDMVWIPTNGGKKYHSSSTCSGMIDPELVTKEEAINRGFDACKRCH